MTYIQPSSEDLEQARDALRSALDQVWAEKGFGVTEEVDTAEDEECVCGLDEWKHIRLRVFCPKHDARYAPKN